MAVLISGWGVEAKKSSAGLHFFQFLPNSVYFSHSLEDSRPPTSKAPRPVRELQIRMPCEAFSAAWRHGATLTHSVHPGGRCDPRGNRPNNRLQSDVFRASARKRAATLTFTPQGRTTAGPALTAPGPAGSLPHESRNWRSRTGHLAGAACAPDQGPFARLF